MKKTLIFATLLVTACGNATQATDGNSADSTDCIADTATYKAAETAADEKNSEIYPFTIKGIHEALDCCDFNPENYVYILYDIDGDGQNEMFIKERTKEYNDYMVLNIEDGKENLVASRMSGNIEYYEVYDDGYFVHIQEGRDRACATNYKFEKSKVVAVSQYAYESDWSDWEEGDDEPEIHESWSLNYKDVKKEVYNKYVPKGISISLYDLEGWKDFHTETARKSAEKQLKTSGRLVNELVPSTWERTQSAKGDINKDGFNDLAIVTLPNNKENIMTREDGYEKNLNKPVVAVYLGDKYGKYELWKTSTSIIPPMDEFMSIESMSVEIKPNGVLWVKYSDFYSAGTADVTTYTQLYRAQDGGLYLIGQEEKSFSRYTHEEITSSVNYLAGRKTTHTSGRAKDEEEKLKKEPLRTFEEGNRY